MSFHVNPAHAEYVIDDGKSAAALVPLDKVVNLVHPDEFPEKREDLTGILRLTRGELQDMGDDVKTNGLDQDVVMRRIGGDQYEIVDGIHRCGSLVAAGMETVPARFRDDYTDQEAALRRILANQLRKDLSPLQEAIDWQRALDTGIEQKELAKRVKKSPATISKRLKLLQVPACIADLAPKHITFEEIPWWAPLHGHDELAERVAEKIRKDDRKVGPYQRVDVIVDVLGITEASHGAAPLNSRWASKVAKVPYWELYGFVTDELRKKARKLPHLNFGTKSDPDLILVLDVPAAVDLVNEATKEMQERKKADAAKMAALRDKNKKARALEQQEERAIHVRRLERIKQRLEPVKKMDQDMVDAMGALLFHRAGYDMDVVKDYELGTLQDLLGKDADVLDVKEKDGGEPYVRLDADLFQRARGRSPAVGNKLLGFLVAQNMLDRLRYSPVDDFSAPYKQLIGETPKQTTSHAKRALEAAA